MLGVPFCSVLDGGEPAQGGMRSVGVVLGPPAADNDFGFQERGELLDVEQLVAYAAVEALDEGFSHGEPGSM